MQSCHKKKLRVILLDSTNQEGNVLHIECLGQENSMRLIMNEYALISEIRLIARKYSVTALKLLGRYIYLPSYGSKKSAM